MALQAYLSRDRFRRHRLLCPRRERPSGSRAADQNDELAPLYLTELHLTLDEPGLRRKLCRVDGASARRARTSVFSSET
jgi:hypothetical protein